MVPHMKHICHLRFTAAPPMHREAGIGHVTRREGVTVQYRTVEVLLCNQCFRTYLLFFSLYVLLFDATLKPVKKN